MPGIVCLRVVHSARLAGVAAPSCHSRLPLPACRWCCDWDDNTPGLEVKTAAGIGWALLLLLRCCCRCLQLRGLQLLAAHALSLSTPPTCIVLLCSLLRGCSLPTDGPSGFAEVAPTGRCVGACWRRGRTRAAAGMLGAQADDVRGHAFPTAAAVVACRSWMARWGLAGHTSFLEPGSLVFGGTTCPAALDNGFIVSLWEPPRGGGVAGCLRACSWAAAAQPLASRAAAATPICCNALQIVDSIALTAAFFETRLRGQPGPQEHALAWAARRPSAMASLAR